MKGTLAIICFVLCATLAACSRPKWHELQGYTFSQYIQDFGKRYDNSEYHLRKQLFEARLESVKRGNQDTSRTWKEGINHLSDLSDAEIKKRNGYKPAQNLLGPQRIAAPSVPTIERLPERVDWREAGVITPVKDQGNCGSCWVFGTVETVESYYALAQGSERLTDFSVQQILDCTANPDKCGGTGGCEGGTAELAMASVIKMGGLATEWTYPYVSHDGHDVSNCSSTTKPLVAKLEAFAVLPANEYAPIMSALSRTGPLIINVDASVWSSYESGVFNGCNQTDPDIDHVVQLVGYGTDEKLGDYWLVRNSWTPLWGEYGYIRLARSSTVQCGTDTQPQDGTGCQGGPNQTVCGTCGVLFDVSYPVIV